MFKNTVELCCGQNLRKSIANEKGLRFTILSEASTLQHFMSWSVKWCSLNHCLMGSTLENDKIHAESLPALPSWRCHSPKSMVNPIFLASQVTPPQQFISLLFVSLCDLLLAYLFSWKKLNRKSR